MSILLVVLAVILLFVVAVLLLALRQPDVFKVERSVEIQAKPESVAPLILNFRKWTMWSPWEKMDQFLKQNYTGPESGIGATYAWEGRKSGKGSMEILGQEGSSRIVLRLDFEKPFEAHNQVVFSLDQIGDKTRATWAMSGPNKFFPGKVFHVFVNMDKMVGKDFQTGLVALKQVVEASP